MANISTNRRVWLRNWTHGKIQPDFPDCPHKGGEWYTRWLGWTPVFSVVHILNCTAEGNQDVTLWGDVLQASASAYIILLLTKLVTFSLCCYRKPMLPIKMEFLAKDRTPKEDNIKTEWDTEDIVQQALNLSTKFMLKPSLTLRLHRKWTRSTYYDKKHADPKVCTL